MSDQVREMLGGGLEVSVGANYYLRRPTGPQGRRAYLLDVTTSGVDVFAPDASNLQVGTEIVVFTTAGSNASELYTHDGGTLLSVLPSSSCVSIVLIANGTEAGEWAVLSSTPAFGSQLPADSRFYHVTIDTPVADFNLRTELEETYGYDGTHAVALLVQVRALVYSTTTSGYAFNTGLWPSGSSLILDVTDYISGRGGDGGDGANAPGGGAFGGGNGGSALYLGMDTVLTGSGTVQGGGGGGGGGPIDPSFPGIPGSGGGGGAGWLPSAGGIGGSNTSQGTKVTDGRPGGLTGGGLGGGNFFGANNYGGAGGDPGQAGAAGGGTNAGGTAGAAVDYGTATYGITYSKVNWTGTISGGENSV